RPGEPQVPTTMSASTLMSENSSVVGSCQPEEGKNLILEPMNSFETISSSPIPAPSTTNQANPRDDSQCLDDTIDISESDEDEPGTHNDGANDSNHAEPAKNNVSPVPTQNSNHETAGKTNLFK